MTEPAPLVLTAADAAAAWWARALENPSFNNGGDPIAGLLAHMLATKRDNGTPDKMQAFTQALARRVQEAFAREVKFNDEHYLGKVKSSNVMLDVDYHPDAMLRDAAAEAGITNEFPWKTLMRVSEDHVTVSCGYRAPTVLVWATPEWLANRPMCDSQKWDEAKSEKVGWKNYHGEPFECSLPKYHAEAQHVYDRPIPMCAQCGAPESDYDHNAQAHGPDSHAFVAPAPVQS